MGVKGFQLWLRVEASLLASHFEGLNSAESLFRFGQLWYPDLGMLFGLKKTVFLYFKVVTNWVRASVGLLSPSNRPVLPGGSY